MVIFSYLQCLFKESNSTYSLFIFHIHNGSMKRVNCKMPLILDV